MDEDEAAAAVLEVLAENLPEVVHLEVQGGPFGDTVAAGNALDVQVNGEIAGIVFEDGLFLGGLVAAGRDCVAQAAVFLGIDGDEFAADGADAEAVELQFVVAFAEADDGSVISTIKKYTTSESLAFRFYRNLPETYVSGQEVEIPARSVVTLLLGLTKDQQHLQGDVNGDGLVDIDDVNAIINAILGITEWHSDYDLTGDGIVDVDDVNAIINIILRIQ